MKALVRRVEVTPHRHGALDWPAMVKQWSTSTAEEDLPSIRLAIRGADLPSWSDDAYTDIQLYDARLKLQKTETVMADDTLLVYIGLREGVRPGDKRITVNGSDATFQLTFADDDRQD